MDDDTRKIMTVIAAFDAEHAWLHETVQSLNRSGEHLTIAVRRKDSVCSWIERPARLVSRETRTMCT
jgi:hypothetical protein